METLVWNIFFSCVLMYFSGPSTMRVLFSHENKLSWEQMNYQNCELLRSDCSHLWSVHDKLVALWNHCALPFAIPIIWVLSELPLFKGLEPESRYSNGHFRLGSTSGNSFRTPYSYTGPLVLWHGFNTPCTEIVILHFYPCVKSTARQEESMNICA